MKRLTQHSIHQYVSEASSELKTLDTADAAGDWRRKHLGSEAPIIGELRLLSSLGIEERRAMGTLLNQAKRELESGLEERMLKIREDTKLRASSSQSLDVTLPGRTPTGGRLHPATRIEREICGIFESMGFQNEEGPEVEWDLYNFGKLNIPKGHPARDMWDTLWVDSPNEVGEYEMLLRTHTSPMQARVMEERQPPIRIISAGKCYRYEATDATHEWHFRQVEGLAVDRGVTFANLKGTLFEFARQMFGEDRQIRFRCDYFPFVEPGVDMSIDCFACDGRGNDCRVCRNSGWIEIMGAGMVHPNVLTGVGYDPDRYTGFAFGLGVERIAMLKYSIDDIRHFYANDIRFLRQF